MDNLSGNIDRFLIIDDHIEEKPYMKENGFISWHFSHLKGRNVKGINQLSVLYSVADYSIPFEKMIEYQVECILNPNNKNYRPTAKREITTKNMYKKNILNP